MTASWKFCNYGEYADLRVSRPLPGTSAKTQRLRIRYIDMARPSMAEEIIPAGAKIVRLHPGILRRAGLQSTFETAVAIVKLHTAVRCDISVPVRVIAQPLYPKILRLARVSPSIFKAHLRMVSVLRQV